jgi:hypothetical protein
MPGVNAVSIPSIRTSQGHQANRTVRTQVIANSAKMFIGGLFDPSTGTAGAQAYTANQVVRGFITNIKTWSGGGYISVFDAATVPGTLQLATNEVNGAYTTISTNADSATDRPDIIEYIALEFGDEIELDLVNNSTGARVNAGTTPASAVRNNFIEPSPNFHYGLDESTANTSASGRNFQIVRRVINRPTRIIARLINPTGANS